MDLRDLSLTYCFGQIKSEYSGDLLLRLQRGKAGLPNYEDTIILETFPLGERNVLNFVTQGVPLPERLYIGVNKKAKEVIDTMCKRNKDKYIDIFSLDELIVSFEVVESMRRSLETSSI